MSVHYSDNNLPSLTPSTHTDRLMVAVSTSPSSVRLVRAGYRMAQQLDADFIAIYIENPTQEIVPVQSQKQVNETLRLAESLGAKVLTITGQSVSKTLLKVAREHQVTQIVIGQTLRSRWQERLQGSIVNTLVRESAEIDVYVISTSRDDFSNSVSLDEQGGLSWQSYLAGILAVGVATLVGYIIDSLFHFNPTNLVMIYLLAIVVTSTRYSYGVAAVASFLSVVVFNVAFVPPRYTFRVEDAEYIITFIGLGSVGLVTAYLASQVRRLAISAQNREQQTARLYAFSQDLAIATDIQTITDNLLSHTTQTLDCELALFLPEQNTLHLQQTSATFYINQREQEAATRAYQQGQQAGKGTKLASDALGLYRPMRVAKQILGVIGIQADAPLSADQERLLDAFVSQYALALEAIQLAQKAQKAELLSAKEKLQQTIISSVSHDLRTPLVSVKGALSSLLQDGDTLTDAMQHELLSGAFEETDRLNRLLGNLLDMSRLQSGAMILKREPYAIAEVISVARTQLQSRLKNHTVQVSLAENLPLIQIDLVLFAQVFVNLLDNAVKYSPPSTTIQIEAVLNDGDVILRVMDEGRGIPEPELVHIFDKFYRASTANSVGGSGLGLSIVQGIVELHDSSITAQNRPDGGTIFTITVPESQTLVI